MTKRYHTPKPTRGQNTRTLRHATVLSSHYPPLADDDDYYANYRPIPWINLRGHWLHHAGFSIGTPYSITVGDGVLVFRVSTSDTEPNKRLSAPMAIQVADT